MSGTNAGYDQESSYAQYWNSSTSGGIYDQGTSEVPSSGMLSSDASQEGLGGILVGGIVAAFKWIGNLFFTKGIILAALLFFVDWVVNFFLELVADIIKMDNLTRMISELPSIDFLKYIFHLTALDYGLPLLLAASLLKFFIRRLPVVG
jgi:hypothetical protein